MWYLTGGRQLAADTDGRTKHDFASEATWADRWREDHYDRTELWHYVDMEIGRPDLMSACFGRSPLPAGTVALDGPPKACVVGKIKQFAAELASSGLHRKARPVPGLHPARQHPRTWLLPLRTIWWHGLGAPARAGRRLHWSLMQCSGSRIARGAAEQLSTTRAQKSRR
jgi:hypothetical protein